MVLENKERVTPGVFSHTPVHPSPKLCCVVQQLSRPESPVGILQLWPHIVSLHSCTPGVETVTGWTRGNLLPPWWFDFRALGKALHIFYCGYFFQVLWEHLRKHWDIFYSGRFENCIKIMIVKSFQWRGFMPLASTISTRGMGNLLNSFLLGYPSFEFSKWEIVFKDLIIYTKYLGRSHSDLVLTGFGDFSVWLIW